MRGASPPPTARSAISVGIIVPRSRVPLPRRRTSSFTCRGEVAARFPGNQPAITPKKPLARPKPSKGLLRTVSQPLRLVCDGSTSLCANTNVLARSRQITCIRRRTGRGRVQSRGCDRARDRCSRGDRHRRTKPGCHGCGDDIRKHQLVAPQPTS